MLTIAQAATATATAAAKKTAEDPKWTEVAGFWVTLAAALITLSAVVVALFGPSWQARRRAPTLSLDLESASVSIPASDANFYLPLRLRVTNASGKDTARNVQMFITASRSEKYRGRTFRHTVAEDAPLRLDDPKRTTGFDGVWSVDVPSGYSRPVWVGMVGSGEWEWPGFDIQSTDEVRAYLTVDSEWLPVVLVNHAHDVRLVITGENFDALHYTAVLIFYDHDGDGSRLKLIWQHRPKLVNPPKRKKAR